MDKKNRYICTGSGAFRSILIGHFVLAQHDSGLCCCISQLYQILHAYGADLITLVGSLAPLLFDFKSVEMLCGPSNARLLVQGFYHMGAMLRWKVAMECKDEFVT